MRQLLKKTGFRTLKNVVDLKRNMDNAYKQEPNYIIKKKKLQNLDEKSHSIRAMIRECEKLMDNEYAFFIMANDPHMAKTCSDLLGYKGAIFENLMADFLCKSGQKLYYFHKDSGLELDFLVRFKGECVILEVKAKSGKAKSMTTVLKNKDVYHVKNAIKLGQYNVGREGDILTIPLYMGFLIEDKIADVIIPDVDLSLLTI